MKEDEAQPKIVVETIIDENNGESSLLRIEGRFTNAQLKKWFSIIEKNVVRTRPNVNSKALPRKTAWFTLKGCNCPYGYSGTHWEPTEFPRWLEELTNLVSKEIGGTCEWGCRPNSCNINLYEDGQDHVGWYSDDEILFGRPNIDKVIISLSLGASRRFQVRRKWDRENVLDRELHSGDIITME